MPDRQGLFLRSIRINSFLTSPTGFQKKRASVSRTKRTGGKPLFAAHIAQDYLTELPDLRICLDISHWCNVHESLLDDQTDAVNLAIAHTDHIHSRVGHPEGPQVNDPRAPEWASTLSTHLAWWDRIMQTHQAAGTSLTVTTEFGPATYMPVMPYTQLPIGDQWEINVFMMNLLKERYA